MEIPDQLVHKIQHDDRRPVKRSLKSQWDYAQQEAKKLAETEWESLQAARVKMTIR